MSPTTHGVDVKIGDRIRFSLALLQAIHDQPGHTSELVEVADIRMDPDGSKVIVMNRLFPVRSEDMREKFRAEQEPV